MTYFILTLGCKVNQYESERMSQLLNESGYARSKNAFEADICVINSCTVTATSDAKCRKMLRRVRRENPNAVILLTGCMPQAFEKESAQIEECDIILGNTKRNEIVSVIEQYLENHQRNIMIEPHEKGESFEKMSVSAFSQRTRAFLKIEDGCNRFCSYCIIPYARGRVRSKTLEDLKGETETLSKNGFREVVLVGINLSAYGEDNGADIVDAVKTVCAVDGVDRVRLGSIEPERMDADVLCALSKEPKFCPQFHLSLQSGCDTTLKRMRRHYTCAEYETIVKNIRTYFNNPSITTDVMVGFAGESDEEFADSLAFCEKIGFARAHVFPYSRRKGTKADLWEDQIDESVKSERAREMIRLSERSQKQFLDAQVGRVESVLVERRDKNGFFEGYTPNYTKVRFSCDDDLSGKIVDVKLISAKQDYCFGELVRG